MTVSEIEQEVQNLTGAEQERYIRRKRAELLEEIHKKQQSLDQLDYLIMQMKQKRR